MSGHPYVNQVGDAPTKKALLRAFDASAAVATDLSAVRVDLAALTAQVAALTSPVTTTQTVISVTGSGGGGSLPSFNPGDTVVADATGTVVGRAAVAAGSYLRSNGVAVPPIWSTLTLPNAATLGDLLVASAANVVGVLADVATGNALISGGVGAAPSYGKIGLTTHVSGLLPYANFVNATAASVLVGRGSAGGAGVMQEITLGANLTMTGTVLSASGGSHALLDGAVDSDTVAYAVVRGSLIVGNSTPKWGGLPIGATGSVLSCDGTDATWSTTPTVTSITTGIVNAPAATNLSFRINTVEKMLIDTGGSWQLTAVVSHAIGTSADTRALLTVGGAWTGASDTIAFLFKPTLQGVATRSIATQWLVPSEYKEASSGNHPLIAVLQVDIPLVYTGGAATVSDTATVYIGNAMSATVTGGNWALWVDNGVTRLDDQIQAGAGSASVPSYSCSGDVNTGVYFDNADGWYVATGGAERLRITATGRVQGIAGDAAAPTYSNSGATTTGLYIVTATPAVGISTGGTARVLIGPGMQVGAPTGGDLGVGTINVATKISLNNAAYVNPDYALEHYFTGRIDRYRNNPGAATYPGLQPLATLRDVLAQRYRFPQVDRLDSTCVFTRTDIALELLEEAHLYILELHDRITQLEQGY